MFRKIKYFFRKIFGSKYCGKKNDKQIEDWFSISVGVPKKDPTAKYTVKMSRISGVYNLDSILNCLQLYLMNAFYNENKNSFPGNKEFPEFEDWKDFQIVLASKLEMNELEDDFHGKAYSEDREDYFKKVDLKNFHNFLNGKTALQKIYYEFGIGEYDYTVFPGVAKEGRLLLAEYQGQFWD